MPPGPDPPRILLIYADTVGASMGGVGIRAVEMARALRSATGSKVAIAAAATDGADLGVPVFTYSPHAPRALDALLADAEAVIAQPAWPLVMRRLVRSRARLIFDMYDPEVFGTLEHFAERRAQLRALAAAYATDRVLAALRAGDHVACASERQRDLWLGAMLAAGLITPRLYDSDPGLRSRLEAVPYGVPSEPPVADPANGPRARLGLADAEIVLWNGGLWSWLDADSAIRAIGILRERRPAARLLFMGASTAAPAVRATERARSLARELGLLGSGVVFNEEWVPYEQRAAWLLDADCALSTHLDDLETRFSSRTRLLDCFWAGLPVVCTGGDELAERVEREQLGATVPPADPPAIAAALDQVLSRGRDDYAPRLARTAAELSWSRATAPIVRWLRDPPAPARGRSPRSAAERARTGAYLLAAGTMAALRVGAPSLRP